MSDRKYPRIGSSTRRKTWDTVGGSAIPKCSACGERALFSVWVETNYFRGDDVKRKACRDHKDDASALLLGEPIKANE